MQMMWYPTYGNTTHIHRIKSNQIGITLGINWEILVKLQLTNAFYLGSEAFIINSMWTYDPPQKASKSKIESNP